MSRTHAISIFAFSISPWCTYWQNKQRVIAKWRHRSLDHGLHRPTSRMIRLPRGRRAYSRGLSCSRYPALTRSRVKHHPRDVIIVLPQGFNPQFPQPDENKIILDMMQVQRVATMYPDLVYWIWTLFCHKTSSLEHKGAFPSWLVLVVCNDPKRLTSSN